MALVEGRRRRRSTRALLGYLEVHVFEASPRGLKKSMGVQRIAAAWKTLIPGMSEVICRVEISGVAAQRAETAAAKVGKTSITWDEKLTLPVYEGAKELRLLLLAPGVAGGSPRTVANGGFYVEDIMASPSNCKWFELFAPGGSAGGTIKLSILYTAATTIERQRRQSVNAETQASHDLGTETERIPGKSFDSSEASINTDPIADSPAVRPAPAAARRSITVHVGVGPSPVPSERNSPAAAIALSTQRRASRQSRTSKTPEPQPEPIAVADEARSPPIARELAHSGTSPRASTADAAASASEAVDEEPIGTAAVVESETREGSGGVKDAITVPIDASTSIDVLPDEAVPAHLAADVTTAEPTAALQDDCAQEANGIDVEGVSEETEPAAETSDCELVSSPPEEKAQGIPSVVLFGVAAVAAVIGAVVLGSKRGASSKKNGRAEAPPQSRADIIQYAKGPRI